MRFSTVVMAAVSQELEIPVVVVVATRHLNSLQITAVGAVRVSL
jgi:hypothetical protein